MTAETILRVLAASGASGWAVLAVKATACMLATLLLVRMTGRASASLRHLLVAATFGVLLFLPLTAALAPARVVRIPAARTRASDVARSLPPAQTPNGSRPSSPPGPGRRLDPIDLAYGVYVAGASALILSLAVGARRVHRLRRSAEVSVAGARLANEMARANGMRTGIEVTVSPDLAVPLTFGVTHPVILLPGSIAGWGEEERGRAVRHELEHIARRDWATHAVSRLVCALYWPHPFAWVLWRRLRLEAERACDDAVIRSFGSAEPYAEQLVSLARQVTHRGSVPAPAMATRSDLGFRVEAILDRRLRRAPLTKARALVVTVIAVVFLLGVAPFKLMTAAVEPAADRTLAAEDTGPLDNALMMAAGRGDIPTMRRLLDHGARANAAIDGDGSPLIAAARNGRVEGMKMLVASGADVNLGVPGDGNPLTAAASGGHLEAVRFLLERGARIDEGLEGDGNALIMAAGAGRLEVVRFLLDQGADIEKLVCGDENALIHASETGQAEVVRFLIGRGANVNARVRVESGDGGATRQVWRTPLVMARRGHHDEVVRILLAAGAGE